MNCCKSSQCQGVEKVFDTGLAENDLKKYQGKGPEKETRRLIEIIKSRGVENATLLDIGGGAGAIQHELHKAGVSRVINVDASPAYSQTAKMEAARLGYLQEAVYHVGDFVDLAPGITGVDIVTLDRVICCYDDMPSLVHASSRLAGRVYGVVFPVDTWYTKLGFRIANIFLALSRNPFRIFIHSTNEIEKIIANNGLRRVFQQKGWFWQVRVYAR